MPLARIITPTRDDALPLASRLQAHGYTVEIVGRGNESRDAADLEIELDKMESHQALAQAARLSRGKQVNVFIAPGCLDEPQPLPEEPSVAEQLLDAMQAPRSIEPELVEVPVQAIPLPRGGRKDRQAAPRKSLRQEYTLWIGELRASLHAFARDVATHSRALLVNVRPVLKKIQLGTASAFALAKWKSTVERTRLQQRWDEYRQTRATTLQRRHEAKIEQMRHGELERARHLLEQQEEKRREIIHKRMAEEERAKQRLIEEQLRRVREAEEEERRQMEREAQLERQRHEAVRLAQERERVARERAERDRLAEEARRIRAEEAERRRREREEQVLQRSEEPNLTQESRDNAHDGDREQPQEPQTFEPQPPPEAPVSAGDPSVEIVPAYAHAEQISHSHFDSDLNSPYHPGWTWAAAAAGAATVGIMLLWTAVSASRSAVHFEALSPSSLLPARASQIQQQVPFGPVKVVVQKSGTMPVKPIPAAVPIAAAPVSTTPVSTAPLAVPSKQAIAIPKPSAAKSQLASSATTDTSDGGPEVVIRHFNNQPTKAQVPQAGQTAAVKRYSDMN